jgi:hypothetical protein
MKRLNSVSTGVFMRRVLITFAAAGALVLSSGSVFAAPRSDLHIPEGDSGNVELIDEDLDPGDIPEIDPQTDIQRLAVEYLYATGFHPHANELRGVRDSLYQGKWFMPRHEDRRQCIMKRESNGNYEAVSSRGLYRGAYQMNRALAVGATWMMQREVRREMGEEGVRLLQQLRQVPPNKWNRYWQDRAFWTVWSYGKGKRHWRGGAHSC